MSISFSNNVDIGGNIGGGEVKNQNKTITANGVYTADAGYTGLGTVTVSVEDTGVNIPKSVVSNIFTSSNTVSSYTIPAAATDVGEGAFAYAFVNSSALQSFNASSLQGITGSSAFRYAFKNSSIETLDFSKLETINGNYAFYYLCEGATSLVSADFSSLTSITGNYVFYDAFSGSNISKFSSSTTGRAEFPQLTTITGGNVFYALFSGCNNITSVRFPVLNSITDDTGSNSVFYGAFGNSAITSVYFNALTSNSFSGDPFKNMFINNYNNITVHFKNNSALKTKIQGLSSYPRFGAPGDTVTVSFDL